MHAERAEHLFAQVVAEALAGKGLEHEAGPVDAGAVVPIVAGIEQQRREEAVAPGRQARAPGRGGKAGVVGIAEIIGEAGGMEQQHAGGDVTLGRAEQRPAVPVEAGQDLHSAELGKRSPRRGVEIEAPLLHQLQDAGRRDRLGAGVEGQDGVDRERRGSAFEQCRVAAGRDGDKARDGSGVVDRCSQRVHQATSISAFCISRLRLAICTSLAPASARSKASGFSRHTLHLEAH